MSKVPTLVILQGMADALPTHPKGDDTSDLASSYEAIGLAVHAYLVAMGFRFIGFDESKHIGTFSCSSSDDIYFTLTSTPSPQLKQSL